MIEINVPIQRIAGDYISFPYPANPPSNIGGIDLVKEPNRIEEIYEANNFPELKNLIKTTNRPDGSLQTGNCDFGSVDGFFIGWIDFFFRDPSRCKSPEYNEFLSGYLNALQLDLAKVQEALSPRLIDTVLEAKNVRVYRLLIDFQLQDQSEAGKFLDTLNAYILKSY